MKKSYLFAFAAGCMLLGSCANDAPEAVTYEPDEHGNIGYIRMSIANSETRAIAEDLGTDDERSIKHIDFLFIGVDGKTFNQRMMASDIENNQVVVPLEKMPRSVAVIVNGEGNYSDNTNLGTDKFSVDRYTNKASAANTDFYMSSSRYWTNGANPQPIYRTEITQANVHKSKEDAEACSDAILLKVERYVAKVKINANVTLDANGAVNPIKDKTPGDGEAIEAGKVTFDGKNAAVTFKPEYICLTSVNDKAYRLKNIPTWEEMKTLGLQDWCNDFGGKRSFWVGEDAGQVKFATLNQLKGNTATFGRAYGNVGEADKSKNNPFFYPFENNQDKTAMKTSVAVVGKYTVVDPSNANNKLTADDGTFYLVAFENNYVIYKSEGDAIKAMGGRYDDEFKDELIPEGKNEDGTSYGINAGDSSDKWAGWSGWMKLKTGSSVVRCVKYNGGYGYYVKEIIRHTDASNNEYAAIVRNHSYTININGIGGMGIGIPTGDTPLINVDSPDPTEQHYFLNMSVSVAPWVTVTSQGVNWE